MQNNQRAAGRRSRSTPTPLAVFGALLLSACTPPPAAPITLCADPNARPEDGGFVDAGFPFGGGVPVAPPEPIRPVGRPIGLVLGLALTPRCVGQQQLAQQVRTEVLDGEGRPVEHTASAPITAAGVASTVVSFVPQTAGSYYVKVRFEPDLGAAQRLVDVFDSASAVLLDALPAVACNSVALLPSHAVLCFASGEVVVRRDGVEVQRLPLEARAWVTAGRALWLDDESSRHRLLDVGSGPLLDGGAPGGLSMAGATVFATEDAFFSILRNRIARQAVEGDALGQTVFTIPPQQGGALALPAMGLALDSARLAFAGSDGLVCQLRLPASTGASAEVLRCDAQPSPQPVIAAEGERFWFQQPDGFLLAARPQPDRLRVERFVDARLSRFASTEGKGLPALRAEDSRHLVLPRLGPAPQPVVVEFPLDLGGAVRVGEGTVTALSADGATYLFFSW